MNDVRALVAALDAADYLADDRLAMAVFLAMKLERPLLVEGPAGVGKTDLARAVAAATGRSFLRLQCYEGLDESRAIYDWDYAKQILYTQLLRDTVRDKVEGQSITSAMDALGDANVAFFDRRFLIERPLLKAVTSATPVVLLVDEVDRADPEFEALLLELLAERQVTIPELGTLRGPHAPLVVLTTNGTREMTDALRRRCLHAFVDYPAPSRELAIVLRRVPGISERLAEHLTRFVAELRDRELRKAPSIAETVDWAKSIVLLGGSAIDSAAARDTLAALVKHQEDRDQAATALEKFAKKNV
jgi:MoxR-like ATPase